MSKIIKIEIISRPRDYEKLIEEFDDVGVTGMTVTQVMGRGNQKGVPFHYRGVNFTPKLLPKVKIEVVTTEEHVESIVKKARSILKTGNAGDGKIFITELSNVIRIRDGQEGIGAIK